MSREDNFIQLLDHGGLAQLYHRLSMSQLVTPAECLRAIISLTGIDLGILIWC